MDFNLIERLQKENQLVKLKEANDYAKRYGLSLSEKDMELILSERKEALKTQKRVEFGEGIVSKIIYEFCDSSFIDQSNYADTIMRLQDIFYLYKNEMLDEITDDELLHFMREQFETVCSGDLDYLEGTCLDIFAQAIRAGYGGCGESDGYGEFKKFDIVTRWDHELYLEALSNLF